MKKPLTDIKSDWIDKCIETLLARIRPGGHFSSIYIYSVMGDPPHPNYYGCAIGQMVKAGLIKEAGFIRSTRPSANGRRIIVWRMK